jgi:hypothetical protein
MSIIKTLKNHSYMFRPLNDHPQGVIWSLLKLQYLVKIFIYGKPGYAAAYVH